MENQVNIREELNAGFEKCAAEPGFFDQVSGYFKSNPQAYRMLAGAGIGGLGGLLSSRATGGDWLSSAVLGAGLGAGAGYGYDRYLTADKLPQFMHRDPSKEQISQGRELVNARSKSQIKSPAWAGAKELASHLYNPYKWGKSIYNYYSK